MCGAPAGTDAYLLLYSIRDWGLGGAVEGVWICRRVGCNNATVAWVSYSRKLGLRASLQPYKEVFLVSGKVARTPEGLFGGPGTPSPIVLTAAGNDVARMLLLAHIMSNSKMGHASYAKHLRACGQEPMGSTFYTGFMEELLTVVTALLQQQCGVACAYVLLRSEETGEGVALATDGAYMNVGHFSTGMIGILLCIRTHLVVGATNVTLKRARLAPTSPGFVDITNVQHSGSATSMEPVAFVRNIGKVGDNGIKDVAFLVADGDASVLGTAPMLLEGVKVCRCANHHMRNMGKALQKA